MVSSQLSIVPQVWRPLTEQLWRRGEGRHEAGAFLYGTTLGNTRTVTGAIYYDELDPEAYRTGVCVLLAGSFAMLWRRCREQRLTIVADIHTHPLGARQSLIDQRNPMIARSGHVAIIVPSFAAAPVQPSRLGVYIYQGNHRWSNQSPSTGSKFLRV